MNNDKQITYFAETDARNKRVRFGIKAEDRTKHIYVIGKTGMGKSTLLENMAVQDILNGNGLAFIDPHGKTAELLLEYVPEHRLKDVLYFAPFDLDNPISFNVMEDVEPDRRHLVVSGLMSVFKKIWVDAWSARMEYILNNTLFALLEYPGSTLLSVNRMLSDKDFRKKVVENITNPAVKSFWVDEFAKYTDKFAAEATPAIQNKIGQFTSNALIRNIIGQPKSTFDIRKLMDEKKILIVNLSKGLVGDANANLLGSMMITKIYLAAMSRANVYHGDMAKLPNFYFYVDEFQSFANESFASILSEARKYKLNLTIAHQYIEQMSEEVRAAVFGNVGTMITFRVGAPDADVLEKEFAPYFEAQDLVNLDKYQLYLKLMIDGVASQPFSAVGMAPIEKPIVTFVPQLIESSRKQFSRPRAEVEALIKSFHEESHGVARPTTGGASSGVGGGFKSQGGGAHSGSSHNTHASPRSEGPKPAPVNTVNLGAILEKAMSAKGAEVSTAPVTQSQPEKPTVSQVLATPVSMPPRNKPQTSQNQPQNQMSAKPVHGNGSTASHAPAHTASAAPKSASAGQAAPTRIDLQRAIAAGDLIPLDEMPKEEKKDEKKNVGAQKESVQNLKSALAELLKQAPQSAAASSTNPATGTAPTAAPKQVVYQAAAQAVVTPVKSTGTSAAPAQTKPIEPVRTAPLAAANQSVNQTQNQSPSEVPESILRKVLDMNE